MAATDQRINRLADDLHELREELRLLGEESARTIRAQIPIFEQKIAKLVRELDELASEQQPRKQTSRQEADE